MKNIQEIPLNHIVPDENQPRKYFSAEKIRTLKNSIAKLGIKSPLVVQEFGKDKFLLIDGERRFRAAGELKMKTVPCVVEKPQTEAERLVVQFEIQEQHEQWTPVEKAVAVDKLSSALGLSLSETCKLLNVTSSDKRKYESFAQLVDKTTWIRNEIPLEIAASMRTLKNAAKRVMEEELEEEFNRDTEKKIESRIIKLVKSGDIRRATDVTRVKDAFLTKPATIKELLTTDVTPAKLFLSSKAKGSYHLRNCHTHAGWVTSHGNNFLRTKDIKITEDQLATFKSAKKTLEALIELA